jgi:hypothetical protein
MSLSACFVTSRLATGKSLIFFTVYLYLKFGGPHGRSILEDNMHNCIYVSLTVEAYGAASIVIAVAAWSEPRIDCN